MPKEWILSLGLFVTATAAVGAEDTKPLPLATLEGPVAVRAPAPTGELVLVSGVASDQPGSGTIQPVPLSIPVPQTIPTPVAPCPELGSFAPECPFDCRLAPATPCVWGGADYLLWWIKSGPLPVPLATTGNPNDLSPGALGQPGTQVLDGGSGVSYGTFNGGRATIGGWLDDNQFIGIEGSGFLLEQRVNRFDAVSNPGGLPPIYVPIFRPDTTPPGEGSITIADPFARVSGGVSIASSSQLWGAEANGLMNVYRGPGFSFDLIAGFRYLDLSERLEMSTISTDFPHDSSIGTVDDFRTRNQFYGGQLGGRFGFRFGNVSLDAICKVALGANHELVQTSGFSAVSGAGAPVTPGIYSGGIFTAPSNIGTQNMNQFAVVPQLGLKLGWDIRPSVRLLAGYDFLYWNQVARPGSQIDHVVDTTQLLGGPAASQPVPQFNRTDFWAQGVSLGLEIRY